MCKNLKGQHPLAAEIWSSDKVDLEWVEMRQLNSVVSGSKFTRIFPPNARWFVVDHLLFRFSISPFLPETLANRVYSCPKLPQVLVVIALPNFGEWGKLPKVGPKLSCLPRGTSLKQV